METDRDVLDLTTECINEAFDVQPATVTDLLWGIQFMDKHRVRKFDLIVCAETMFETDGDKLPSNGLRMMQDFRATGFRTPIIILTDDRSTTLDNLTPVYRGQNGFHSRLLRALGDLFPHRI
jgi:DNA-binding NarL/FixJ family response regulator